MIYDDDEDFTPLILDGKPHTWGAERVGFCMDCLVSHEYVMLYTVPVNPLEAEYTGTLWLCDDDDEDDLLEDEDD